MSPGAGFGVGVVSGCGSGLVQAWRGVGSKERNGTLGSGGNRKGPFFATPRTEARQAPLSMKISRQDYWSGLTCPTPGDLPDPGIEPSSPVSPALQADSLLLEPSRRPMEHKLTMMKH